METNDEHRQEADEPIVAGRFAQHRFMILIGGSVIIACVLVLISMQLYSTSGTAQLDLSRPGYKSVRGQIQRDDTFDGFPATGTIDTAALDNFKALYDKRAKQVTTVDAFGSDVLSDRALGIDAPTQ